MKTYTSPSTAAIIAARAAKRAAIDAREETRNGGLEDPDASRYTIAGACHDAASQHDAASEAHDDAIQQGEVKDPTAHVGASAAHRVAAAAYHTALETIELMADDEEDENIRDTMTWMMVEDAASASERALTMSLEAWAADLIK